MFYLDCEPAAGFYPPPRPSPARGEGDLWVIGCERPYNALRLARALAGEEKKHSTLAKLTDWAATVDKVLVF